MRAHVVFAHPEPKSFCAAMKDTTMAALAEAGYVITISDLYAEHFNPVASAADFVVRRHIVLCGLRSAGTFLVLPRALRQRSRASK